MQKEATEITGLTLIEKALEFESMETDKAQWTFDKQKDNPPRFVRLQQLNVLLQVFTPEIYNPNDIASGIDDLISGEFIFCRKKKYSQLFKEMDNVINIATENRSKKHREWGLYELQFNYKHILKFKRRINEVLTFNCGRIETSYHTSYSEIMTRKVLDTLDTKEIDDFLSLVIDPAGKRFHRDELIKTYNYPTEDIFDVDLDWF